MEPSEKLPTRPHLDGITLETIVTWLADNIGWEAMAAAVPVRCFTLDPSIKSSLKFLRRTPWARKKVEDLYLRYAVGAEVRASPLALPHEATCANMQPRISSTTKGGADRRWTTSRKN